MLIVVEGIDCSGKDTLTAKLIEELEEYGHEVISVREPSAHSDHTREIRHKLEFGAGLTDMCRYRLLMEARDCLMRELVSPALDDHKKVVVSNRSFISTLAYQTELNTDEVFAENKKLLREYNTVPDMVIFLDIEHETYLTRVQQRREEKSNLEKWIDKKENFDAVRDRYLDIMYDKVFFDNLGGSKHIHTLLLDGELPIHENIRNILTVLH